jgi:hypothetical protein
LNFAHETGWDSTHVLGELRKLTSRMVLPQTDRHIMKAKGLDPGPKRSEKTWDKSIESRYFTGMRHGEQ